MRPVKICRDVRQDKPMVSKLWGNLLSLLGKMALSVESLLTRS